MEMKVLKLPIIYKCLFLFHKVGVDFCACMFACIYVCVYDFSLDHLS